MTRGTRRHVRPARGAPRRKMTRLSSFSTSAPACAWPQRAKRAVGVRGVAGARCGASGSATPARRGGERQRCVRKRRRRRSRCAPPAAAAHGCSALGGGARTAKASAKSWMFGAARPPAPAPLTAPLAMAPSAAPERPRPAPERWPRDGGILLSEVRASEGRHAAPEREKQDALRDARAKHAQSACRCNGSNGARTGAQLRVHQHPTYSFGTCQRSTPLLASPGARREACACRAAPVARAARRSAPTMSRFPQAAPAATATAAGGAGGSAVRTRASGAAGGAGAPAAASGRPAGRVRALETSGAAPVAASYSVLGVAESLLSPLLRRKSVLDSGARRAAAQTKLLWTCGPRSRVRRFCTLALAPRAPRLLTRALAPLAAQPDGAAVALLPVRSLRACHAAAGARTRAVTAFARSLTLSAARQPRLAEQSGRPHHLRAAADAGLRARRLVLPDVAKW